MSQAITVEHNLSPVKQDVLGIDNWPIWSKEVSTFSFTYDQTEKCYFLEGEATVTPDGGEPVHLTEGDYVIFPAGLSCTWEITEDVEKHYDIG